MQRLKTRNSVRFGVLPLLAAALLAGCASTPEAIGSLRRAPVETWPLSPADLPEPLALQQVLVIERGGQSRTFDAILETDADSLRLAVLATGQLALNLRWQGGAIEEERADWLPSQVDGARVLQDLQFALWPLDVLQRAAPKGWRVSEQGEVREFSSAGRPVVLIRRHGALQFTLERPDEGYRLNVQSVVLEEALP